MGGKTEKTGFKKNVWEKKTELGDKKYFDKNFHEVQTFFDLEHGFSPL